MNLPEDTKLEARAQSEWRPGTWLSQYLGFGSIRGRYLWVAGFFVSSALIAGWTAQSIVDQTAHQGSVNVSERKEISRLVSDLSNDIWLAETALQGFVLSPSTRSRVTTLSTHDHLLVDVNKLLKTDWVQSSSTRLEALQKLSKDAQELRIKSEQLIEIRGDAEKLFPAMSLLTNIMMPHNIEFLSQAKLAMTEADDRLDLPSQRKIRELFSEARYAWATMIGNFRLFIANRFGLLSGNQEAGMNQQHQQIEFYSQLVDNQLQALARFEKQGTLELQQGESLIKMRRISQEWRQAYMQAVAIYSTERWRADVPLLRDTIRPLFTRLWVNVNVLHSEIESASVSDVTSIASVADRLSRALWIFSLITIALTAAGYLFFEYTVRRPIANVARALKSEALGVKTPRIQATDTAETRDLIEAFGHMHNKVHSRQERLQTILDNTAEGIVTFDANGRVEGYNQAAQRLFGWSEHEVVGQNIDVLVQREIQTEPNSYLARFLNYETDSLVGEEGEIIGLRKGGGTFAMTIKISGLWLDGKRLYTALVADNSERKAIIERLRAQAEHDSLTGLHNRYYFLEELARVVERARRTHQTSILLYIDLDNFKYVNDTLGHLAGDRLLIEISKLLHQRARRGDLIARLGGDEFSMLLYDTHTDEAKSIAESFRKTLVDFRFRQASTQVDVGCSIGVALIGSGSATAEEVLSRADFACHLAKRGGRNRVHMFDNQDMANVTALSLDMGWSRRIKDAIESNRFVLASQPIVNTRTMLPFAHEILLRLRDEHDVLIMSNGFLPAADRFGLSADIDRWVIVNAIRVLATLRKERPDLRYSVNLSGQSLSEPAICDLVIHELRRTGLDPSALIFEVTETVAIANMTLAETFLARLKEIGCSTSLDDFGAGMSSFAYLRELPVDYVKIDGRFVQNLASNVADQAMVRAMCEIAHTLGKKAIAEFVEDEDCLQLLRQFGVDFVQGFHVGRPEIIPANIGNRPEQNADFRVVQLKPR